MYFQSYSRGAERIRTKSISVSSSGRNSPFSKDIRESQITSAHPETLEEQVSSAAADDSPDHQILMAPRNPKIQPRADIRSTTAQSEDLSDDKKKDN